MAADGLTLLGFDTATVACSAALWAGGEVRACRRVETGGRHAEALVPMLREVAAEGNTTLAAVDRFAVTVGPGSFTGIRIGLATARGLALALDRPLIGLSTLEVIAAGVPEAERDGPILAALDAGRGRLYAQLFGPSLEALGAPEALDAEALPGLVAAKEPGAPVVVVGTGQDAALTALAPAIDARPATGSPTPDARVLVRRAAARGENASSDGAAVRPLYLRAAGARPRSRPAASPSKTDSL
ncbi:MAG: tRNA (adenosine(37)-N6)-threonylcarbamoyltransferase complex dimerization subunit type 1 TsaB [Rhodospirillales bacterium]|nr:tRNA (adenosine(37)-N6)-threonylcarbamoyltransferase complex dimerization subunit type 1 TsaB [Rhodospirillales bacterium]